MNIEKPTTLKKGRNSKLRSNLLICECYQNPTCLLSASLICPEVHCVLIHGRETIHHPNIQLIVTGLHELSEECALDYWGASLSLSLSLSLSTGRAAAAAVHWTPIDFREEQPIDRSQSIWTEFSSETGRSTAVYFLCCQGHMHTYVPRRNKSEGLIIR